jgi:hypothetical protein
MYAADSFFTLSVMGQIGLGFLSLALAVAAIFSSRRMSRSHGIGGRLALVLTIFILFVWLSPQVYYGYYLLLFDGLPIQIVVKMPPSPMTLLRLISFTEDAELSAHSQGVLFWFMIGAAFIRNGTAKRSRQ